MINHRHRRDGLSALERLEQRLERRHEPAWYAERLERLGQVLFGDLWQPKESETVQENHPDEQDEK